MLLVTGFYHRSEVSLERVRRAFQVKFESKLLRTTFTRIKQISYKLVRFISNESS